jgi:hypothetical protein
MRSIREIEDFVQRFYPGRDLLLTPYGYNLTFSATDLIAATGSDTQQLNISANADFILLGIRARADIAAAAQTVSSLVAPLARMLLTDSGSNEQFTQQAIDLMNYTQVGTVEVELPYPRIVAGRSSLQVQMFNYSAASAYNIDVFFSGVLVRAYSTPKSDIR